MNVSVGRNREILMYLSFHNKQVERIAKSPTRNSTKKPQNFNNSFTVIVQNTKEQYMVVRRYLQIISCLLKCGNELHFCFRNYNKCFSQNKKGSFLIPAFLTMVAIGGHCPISKLVDREHEVLEKLENR